MKIVKENIESKFNEFTEDLKELIRIASVYEEDESPYPFGENIDKSLKKMLDIAEKLGFDTYYDPQGYYGYAEYGKGDEMIGILGHLDVVPAGDIKKWETGPFNPVIKDGKFFGRGVQDDKGPTLGAMYALKAIIDRGIEINKKVRFIYGTDEERLWQGISKYNENEKIPDYGFTPDANFPLIYAEKGLLQVDLIAKNESGVILSGGDAYNSVPSKISYETDRTHELSHHLESMGFEHKKEENSVTVMGKSVHAKDAENGINPICRLAMAMRKMGSRSKCIDFIADHINEDALAKSIFGECRDDMSGALKFNIGKINMDEHREVLNVDMRIPVSVEKEFVLERLEAAAGIYGFEIEENDYLKSIYTPLDSELVKILMQSYEEVTGDMESRPISSGGATYARAIDNCVAFGATFPHSDETEHQPNEYVMVDDMKMAINIYSCAIMKMLDL